jgi:hypothetical protein
MEARWITEANQRRGGVRCEVMERQLNGYGAGGPDASSGNACRITDGDRALISLLSMTRYLTRAQAHLLRWPGRDVSVARKRLLQLAGIGRGRTSGDRRPIRGVLDPPYLRRLWYRRATGERVEMWALSRYGEALAAELAGRPPRKYAGDVGEPLREHWAALTDLFVQLVVPLLARGISPHALPLRWDAQDGTELPWREYDATAGKVRERLMVPDAVLELPAARRRYLVECEMGSHSIVAASDEKAGATIRKAERYDEFFAGFADESARLTFYERAFGDRWPAEVVFLVRTGSRRTSVNAALERWRAERGNPIVRAHALTLEEAAREIGLVLGTAPTCSHEPPSVSAPPLRSAEVDVLRRFYQQVLLELRASGRQLPEHVRAIAREARAILDRGQPISVSKEVR